MGDLKDNNDIKKANVWNRNTSDFPQTLIIKYRKLIISPLIVTTMTTFSVYLFQLMTIKDSLIHQKFLILKFCHKQQT